MADLSQLSDEELYKLAGMQGNLVQPDLSQLSDEQLRTMAYGPKPSLAAQALSPIANIPQEISNEAAEGLKTLTRPLPQGNAGKSYMVARDLASGVGDVFGRAGGALQYAASPITGTVRSLVSKPLTNLGVAAGLDPQQSKALIGDNIDLAANIAVPLGAEKLAPRIASAIPTVEGIQGAFEARKAAKAAADAQKVVLPKQTAKQVAEDASKYSSSGGLMNRTIYTPDNYEKQMIDLAAKAGVKSSLPLVENIQLVNKARVAKAQQLGAQLDGLNTPLSPAALDSYGQSIMNNIESNKLLKPHSETVRALLDTAQSAIESNPKTPAGLWQARKDFDQAIEAFQPGALDADATGKAFSYTAKMIRNGMNQAIIDSAPSAGVGQFLNDYTHLSNAYENMAGKLSTQGSNRFSRFFQTTPGKITKYGAGLTAAGAAGNAAINSVGGQ